MRGIVGSSWFSNRSRLFVIAGLGIAVGEAFGQIPTEVPLPSIEIRVPLELGPELAIVQVRRVDGSTDRIRIGDRVSVEVLVRNTGGRPATVQAGTPGEPSRGEGAIRYGSSGTISPGETEALPLELLAIGNRFRGGRFSTDVFLFETRGPERGIKPLFEDGNPSDNQFTVELGFQAPDERAVRILAYNVQFLPPIADDSRCIRLRARLIAQEIERRSPLPDVLAFSEVFDDDARAILVEELADRFPHRSRILGRDSGIEQDGGVIVLSRWPIESQDQRAFGSVCAGMDCRADKGVLYTRIRTRDLVAHIFATHLEAQTRDVKRRQLDIIRAFIEAKRIPANEPVLIAGDFNIDAYGEGEDYPDLLRRLNADYLRLEGDYRYSKDEIANDMASGRRRELIDHIVFSRTNLQPSRSHARIHILRSPWWEEEDDWSANECGVGVRQRDDVTNYQDLSDHYAIEGYAQF